jgi:UDP-N-acetyl-2-amino-2-deoxyglucuronate dehydrogenase
VITVLVRIAYVANNIKMTDPYGDFDNLAYRKKFAIIGVGGYIGKKHLDAIKYNNGEIIAAFDINDSVGILDSYSLNTLFFKKEIDFFSFISNNSIDYISICSPNYTHFDYIQKSLYYKVDVISEKPLVIDTNHIDALIALEKIYHQKIYNIVQLRLNPDVQKIKNNIVQNHKYKINVEYITPRGDWYFKSWKGDYSQSGGLLMNIGVHLFDILLYLFGKPLNFKVLLNQKNKIKGTLTLNNAEVEWFLSLDPKDLKQQTNQPHRKIFIDDTVIDLNENFNNLHRQIYHDIIFYQKGFMINDVKDSILLISDINKTLIS